MPIMFRTNKKATKIAYAVLGKPANMKKTKIKKSENSTTKPLA